MALAIALLIGLFVQSWYGMFRAVLIAQLGLLLIELPQHFHYYPQVADQGEYLALSVVLTISRAFVTLAIASIVYLVASRIRAFRRRVTA